MELYSVSAGQFKLDGGAMFGVVPKSIWSRTNPADEKNLCTWALRCLLVETGDRLILVDTGIGDKQEEKFLSHYQIQGPSLMDSIREAGFSPAEVTDVFLTHLHFDHCGGAVRRERDQGIPVFPDATCWSNERHWRWALSPNDREKASFLKENILPLQQSGVLAWISAPHSSAGDDSPAGDGRSTAHASPAPQTSSLSGDAPAVAAFLPGIDVRFAEGHTSAMMLPQLSFRGRTVVFMADLLPSTGHLPLPYVMAYDMFPLQTMREKKAFLKEAAEKEYVLFFEHDPVNECCTVQMTEKGPRVKEIFRLKDL